MLPRPVAFAAMLLVAGAGGAVAADRPGPPWPEAISPTRITLRWWADQFGEPAAQRVADAHCGVIGRAAALAGIELDGSAEIATYRCR